MKLRQSIILALLDSREFRLRVAIALGFGEQWINKSIAANKVNGPLTTASALQVIREELGLKDFEILEEFEKVQVQN